MASLYCRHAKAADRGNWSVERDVRWDLIDGPLARTQPAILAGLRDAALIEAFHPVNLARLLKLAWDDVDASAVFSMELFEGFKHFLVLRRYLDAVGYAPAITRFTTPSFVPSAIDRSPLSETSASTFSSRFGSAR